MHRFIPATALAAGLLATGTAHAAPVDNWKVFDGQTLTNGTTAGPTIGDNTNNDAEGHFAGLFDSAITLAVGETLTVSGSVVLTGGIDQANQIRFGVFDDGGQFALNSKANWSGGWLHNIDADLCQGRTDGNFGSNGGNAVALSATDVTSGTYDGDSVAAYSFSMAITRDSATTVDIVSSFIGGDGSYSETYTANDVTTSQFTYTAVAWNLAGNSSQDQAVFSNVDATVIPEPASLALLGLGGLLMLGRSRCEA